MDSAYQITFNNRGTDQSLRIGSRVYQPVVSSQRHIPLSFPDYVSMTTRNTRLVDIAQQQRRNADVAQLRREYTQIRPPAYVPQDPHPEPVPYSDIEVTLDHDREIASPPPVYSERNTFPDILEVQTLPGYEHNHHSPPVYQGYVPETTHGDDMLPVYSDTETRQYQ